MLCLLMHLDGEAFALDTSRVVEVLPLVGLIETNAASGAVAGLLNYHGQLVPVVDLAMLMRRRPSVARHSTRIAVLRVAEPIGSTLLGLIAERASQLMSADKDEFAETRVVSDAPYLGGIKLGPQGAVQLIEPGAILASSRYPIAASPDAA